MNLEIVKIVGYQTFLDFGNKIGLGLAQMWEFCKSGYVNVRRLWLNYPLCGSLTYPMPIILWCCYFVAGCCWKGAKLSDPRHRQTQVSCSQWHFSSPVHVDYQEKDSAPLGKGHLSFCRKSFASVQVVIRLYYLWLNLSRAQNCAWNFRTLLGQWTRNHSKSGIAPRNIGVAQICF